MSVLTKIKGLVVKNKKVFIPIMIIIAGFIGMRLMVLSRGAPPKIVKKQLGALVDTMNVTETDYTVKVIGSGTVQARQETSITPEVSGKVTFMSKNFAPGGFFKKGELLFKIEAIDYVLATERAKAAVTKAEFGLATAEGKAHIARLEWEALKKEDEAEPNPLVVYEPQLNEARARVDSARAELKQANLNLERVSIYAPFDCRVRSETIDLGQYLRAGTSIAVVAGTAEAEIMVPLPMDEVYQLDIPRHNSRKKGSKAVVTVTIGGVKHEWKGEVVRSLGEVDPLGRMSRVVVSIKDPYNLKSKPNDLPDDKPDLESGMYVDVTLHGKKLLGIVSIPRSALRDDSTVWLVGSDSKLQITPVTVARSEREKVYISDGLMPGDELILTSIPGAAVGMALRTTTTETPKAQEETPEEDK